MWRFPYVVGNNGGGAFVLLYLFFLIMVGVPVMTMEFAVGRASRQSAVEAYKKLEPAGSKWHIHGVVLPGGLLPADDVLHLGFRLDAGLLLQVPHRHLCRAGHPGRGRRIQRYAGQPL